MKRGITGLWLVTARFDEHFDQRVKLGLTSINSWSLLLDLRIPARTVPAGFGGSGR